VRKKGDCPPADPRHGQVKSGLLDFDCARRAQGLRTHEVKHDDPIVLLGSSAGCLVIDPVYLNNMVIDAEALLDTAVKLPELDGMKRWFGEKNFAQRNASPAFTEVVRKTAALRDSLTAGDTLVEFISKDIRSGAYANLDEPQSRIYLANWFGMKIYSYGERLVTFFHEATHKAPDLKTKDVPWGGGAVGMGDSGAGRAYKGACIALAKDASRHKEALTNAENWGDYLVSTCYRKAGLFEPQKAPDWNNVKSPNDVESKLGPSGNDERLTTFPDMHLPGQTWANATGKREGDVAAVEVPCVLLDGRQVHEFVVQHDRVEKLVLT
jgi:hypothetical protein